MIVTAIIIIVIGLVISASIYVVADMFTSGNTGFTGSKGVKKVVVPCTTYSSITGTGTLIPDTNCKCLNNTLYYLEGGKCNLCPGNSLISTVGLDTPYNSCKCKIGTEWNKNVNKCIESCPLNSSYDAPVGKSVKVVEGQSCNCTNPNTQYILDGKCVNCDLNSVSTSLVPNGVITNRPECRCPLSFNAWDPVKGCTSTCPTNASLDGPGRFTGVVGCNCISSTDLYVENNACKYCPTGTSTNYANQGGSVPNTGERDSTGNIIINNGNELNPCKCPSNSDWDPITQSCKSCPSYSSYTRYTIPDVIDTIGTNSCYCNNSGSNANKVYLSSGSCKYCPGNSTLTDVGPYIDGTNTCRCPTNSIWNGTTCVGVCPVNTSTTGTGGTTSTIVNGSSCKCIDKTYYLDTVGCSQCPFGASTDATSYTGGSLSGKYSSCKCATGNGPSLDGQSCVTMCTDNATISSTATGAYVNVALGSQAQFCRCINNTDIYADNETVRNPPTSYNSNNLGGYCTKCPSGSNRTNTGILVPQYNNMCRCETGKYFNNRENSCTVNTCMANSAIDAAGDLINSTANYCSTDASIGTGACLGTVPCRCTGNYYPKAGSCSICPTNSSATSASNKTLVPNTGCRCNAGYYLNSSNSCVSCPANSVDVGSIPSGISSLYTSMPNTNNQCYCESTFYKNGVCCNSNTYLNSNNQCTSCPTNSYVGLGNIIDTTRFGNCSCSWDSYWDENSKSCIVDSLY